MEECEESGEVREECEREYVWRVEECERECGARAVGSLLRVALSKENKNPTLRMWGTKKDSFLLPIAKEIQYLTAGSLWAIGPKKESAFGYRPQVGFLLDADSQGNSVPYCWLPLGRPQRLIYSWFR